MRPVLALVALLASCSALELKPREKEARKEAPEDDGVDRLGHIRVKPTPTFVATGALTVAATALQMATPGWVRNTLGAEVCEQGAARWLVDFISRVNEFKAASPLAMTMTHGLLLKAIAEVLAQVIPQAGLASAWLDPLRTVRSTIASLLSSSLTFYYWSRLSWLRALRAPAWLAAVFGQRLGTSVTKMVVTQVCYRPINVALFLLGQSFFRGDDARKMLHVMRSKFKGGLVGGILFFAVSNMLMFSVPVPYLHPIIGAIAGLIFNVWLAMVAYKKDPAPDASAASAGEDAGAASALASAAAQLVPASMAAFPTASATLGAVGMLEGVAAFSLYSMARDVAGGKAPRVAGDGSVPLTPSTRNAL